MSNAGPPRPDDARPLGQPASAPYAGLQPSTGTQPSAGLQPYGSSVHTANQATVLALLGRKSAGLAAVLSILLVGAGQMYCGRVGRGLAFLAAAIFSGLLMFVLIGFLTAPIVFVWALVDAISLANRHNAVLAHQLGAGPMPPGYSSWQQR